MLLSGENLMEVNKNGKIDFVEVRLSDEKQFTAKEMKKFIKKPAKKKSK